MDLALYLRVIWRFRRLFFSGLAVALVLAFLSSARISFAGGRPTLGYRGEEQWASFSRVFVTRPGSEWVESITGSGPSTGRASDKVTQAQLEENRLTSLAIIYSSLITSDPIQKLMRASGPVHGEVLAAPLPVMAGSDQLLPIISIEGVAHTKAGSLDLAARATQALVAYVRGQQQANRVPSDRRIVPLVVNGAGDSKLLAGRPKTLPIVVFLTVMLAVMGLIFILENLNPKVRAVQSGEAGGIPVADGQRVPRAG